MTNKTDDEKKIRMLREVEKAKRDPDQAVISQLEWAIERAKAGEMTGFAGVFVMDDGVYRIVTDEIYGNHELLGHICEMQIVLAMWASAEDE